MGFELRDRMIDHRCFIDRIERFVGTVALRFASAED
jgi:hypothetical protein